MTLGRWPVSIGFVLALAGQGCGSPAEGGAEESAAPSVGEQQACADADSFVNSYQRASGLQEIEGMEYDSTPTEIVWTAAGGVASQAEASGNATLKENGGRLEADIRAGTWQPRFNEVIAECDRLGLTFKNDVTEIAGLELP